MQQSNYTFTPHDLRIGNVVNKLIPEDGLNSHLIQFDDLGWLTQWPKNFNAIFSPIPITVEMLVQELGYKYESASEYYYYEATMKYVIKFHGGKFYIGIMVDLGNDEINCLCIEDFTYLHELQNLHYGFTREILTLKSKEK